jgi:hypothetical protein
MTLTLLPPNRVSKDQRKPCGHRDDWGASPTLSRKVGDPPFAPGLL